MAKFTSAQLPYDQTNSFSSIILDYLSYAPELRPFYKYPVNLQGIKDAIGQRSKYPEQRSILSAVLEKQYEGRVLPLKLKENLELLSQPTTYTVTTAHQPNIFTGHLYFVYKIIHAIRLADMLNESIADYRFVPVYYMGSEDADLEELGEIQVNGKIYRWNTAQQGAVGRMKIDKDFIRLIGELEAHLGISPHGNELIQLLKTVYTPGKTIEAATFELVHQLFADYGLVILLPDNPELKRAFAGIVQKELNTQFSAALVEETINAFPEKYKVQAAGRELNLFYLKDDIRERIEKQGDAWVVVNTKLRFNNAEMQEELKHHPERFSPNVILRPLFQEMILPNVAFIGGGGELAYWMELKSVFEAAQIPFPVLVLRNSFSIVPPSIDKLIKKHDLVLQDLFRKELEIVNDKVKQATAHQLDLTSEKQALQEVYKQVASASGEIDPTLQKHVIHLQHEAVKKLDILEKKMLKAERKNFEAMQRQVTAIRNALFPGGTLQERVDNLLPYYAHWGKEFIQAIYDHSTALEQAFTIMSVQEDER